MYQANFFFLLMCLYEQKAFSAAQMATFFYYMVTLCPELGVCIMFILVSL